MARPAVRPPLDSSAGVPCPEVQLGEAALLACVDVPALPLQLLARRHGDQKEWAEVPAVVVSEDRPQGIILQVNRKARAARILPGMRYAAALSLASDLRAGIVTAQEEQGAIDAIAEALRRFSPEVEPCRDEPGVFWLDATGLLGLFGSHRRWAEELRAHLRDQGLYAAVAVGSRRFALYAIARHFRGLRVCTSPEQEEVWLRQVALASLGPLLGLDPATRDALGLLGVHDLGQFLDLPRTGLHERHGAATERLHRMATGDVVLPLRPEHPQAPIATVRDVEPPDDQAERLLFLVRSMLHGLLRQTAARHQAVNGLVLRLELERPPGDKQVDGAAQATTAPVLEETLRPAEPSLQESQLLDLVRLKLEHLVLPARVERLGLHLLVVPATASQLRLWLLSGRRDLDAATLALARLRAAFGPEAVLRAELRSAHLPEARFAWQPLDAMVQARPVLDAERHQLVRRLYRRPVPLPSRPKHEPDGWLLADWRQGSVVKIWGPFRLTGGWWVREVRRDYYYVETERGDLLWVFYDLVRRRWFLQGEVD